MRSAEGIAGLAIAALVAACGGASSGSSDAQTARLSRYSCEQDEVFSAAVQAIEKDFKKTLQADKATGEVISQPRWFDKDGSPRPDEMALTQLAKGDIALAIRVRIIDLEPNYRVQVDAAVKQNVDGSAQPRDLPEGDPERPGWVQTRIDEVSADIHGRLESCSALIREPR